MQVSVYTRSSNEYLKYTGKKKSNCFVNIKKYIKLFFICACVDLKEMGVLKILHSKMTEKSPLPPPSRIHKDFYLLIQYSTFSRHVHFINRLDKGKQNSYKVRSKKKTDGVPKLDNRCYTMIGKRHNTNCDLDPIQ